MPRYAVQATGTEKKEGETAVYRHYMFADKLLAHPPNVYTMWQMYLHGYAKSTHGPFLGTRRIENGVAKEYTWETHRQVKVHVENFGKGLVSLGLKRQEALGICSINRREWVITELTCYREAFIIVALYDTLGFDATAHIVNEANIEFIISTKDKIQTLIKLKEKITSIQHIISMDEDVNADDLKDAQNLGLKIHTFQQVEKLGEIISEPSVMPSGDDVATICYTSGTTGIPKGAVLTQAACVASVYAIAHTSEIGCQASIDKNDVYISYLPLAHVLERVSIGYATYHGCAIGFYQGDTVKLMDDIVELKPTVFLSVPRLFNRIYDKVLASVNAKGGVAKYLFDFAYQAKKANLDYTVHHWIYDRLVFKPIRERLGGRIRFISSASAPISPEVIDFLRICFSANVHEGYGQTETYCGGTFTRLGDNTAGNVGVPFPCSEVKLVDVPDMNYLSTDLPFPRGEICIRGPSLMTGYYNNPEKTAEAIDSEGWLHTGDIGQFDDNQRLTIIDRLKNIFKLSQGEYVAPEKIESIYQEHELISQAFVHGDSKQSQLVGVIVPDKQTMLRWASKQQPFVSMSLEELCKSEEVKAELLKSLATFGKEHQLQGFEQIKAIQLETNEFTVENNLLSPTFKLKREVARSVYAGQIKSMYDKLSNGRDFN